MSRLRKWDERRLCHEEAQITNVFTCIGPSTSHVIVYLPTTPSGSSNWAAALSTSNSFLQTP